MSNVSCITFVHTLYNKADVYIAAQHYTLYKKIENNFHVNFVVQSVYKCYAVNINLFELSNVYRTTNVQTLYKK
jgi:hypothetical protein